MKNIIKLLMPTLFPSWRFFDVIAPSPRIQYALLRSEHETTSVWLEFSPLPEKLSLMKTLKQMLWNPDWNESLFLTSCAERLLYNHTKHSEYEILKRITSRLLRNSENFDQGMTTHLRFRILLIQRHGDRIEQDIVFYSRTAPFRENGKKWS